MNEGHVFGMKTTEVTFCLLSASDQGFAMPVIVLALILPLHEVDFIHWKATVFLFVINKNLGGDVLRLCQYPVSP